MTTPRTGGGRGTRAAAGVVALALLAGCSQIRLGTDLGAPDPTAPTPPLAERWERDADGAFGPSPALVTDRFVVVGTRRGEVVVLDRSTGSLEGEGEFGASVEGRIAVSADGVTIFVPTAEEGGGVQAYDVRRGVLRWRWRGGPVSAGVALADGGLVVPTLDGRVLGLDAATGDVRWERAATAGAQHHAAPLSLGADVVVADDRGRVVRLAAASGDVVWSADVGAPVYAAPSAAGGALYVSTTRGHVVCLDVASGAEAWRVEAAGAPRASPVAPGPGGLAVGFSDGTARLLDPATGAERWRFTADGNVTAAPAWAGDRVAIGTMDERLVLLDAADGAPVWSTRLRGRVKSALAVGGGMLVALVEPRHVVAFHTAP